MSQFESKSFPKLRNEKPVLFSEESAGGMSLGRAQLNRPQALNSLNTECYAMLEPRLLEWEADPAIAAIVLEATSEKAFCAGGDVKGLVLALREENLDLIREFFTREYFVDYLIGVFKKPIVALADGITMGGGLGLIHGASHRVVTERTIIAMPEQGIGLFPDVGATGFLSKLPHHFGLFLGLTGARISGADAMACGLADYFLPSPHKRRLQADLLRLPWGAKDNGQALTSYLDQVCPEPPPAEGFLAYIEHAAAIFALSSYEELAEKFTATPFALPFLHEAQERFRSGSPTSKRVFFEAYHRHQNLKPRDVFIAEWDMALSFSKGHEFREGVRAVLIDKDQKPAWQPSTDHEFAQGLSVGSIDLATFFKNGETNLLTKKLSEFGR